MFNMQCAKQCEKEKCPIFVKLTTSYDDAETKKKISKEEGRCAIAWLPILLVELKQEISKVKGD